MSNRTGSGRKWSIAAVTAVLSLAGLVLPFAAEASANSATGEITVPVLAAQRGTDSPSSPLDLARARRAALEIGGMNDASHADLASARAQVLNQMATQVGSAAQAADLKKLMDSRDAQEMARRKSGTLTVGSTMGSAAVLSHDAAATGLTVAPMTAGSYTLTASFGATGLWFPYHTGQDFAAPQGTPVYAIVDGVVGYNINDFWAGNHVVLYHGDGGASLYAHLVDTTVTPGTIVHAGDLIGHVGNTGRSFGPHLHFEVYPAGAVPGDNLKCVDPMAWLRQHGVAV